MWVAGAETTIECAWLDAEEAAEVESRLHGEMVLLDEPVERLHVRCVGGVVETHLVGSGEPRHCTSESEEHTKHHVLAAATECLSPLDVEPRVAAAPVDNAPSPLVEAEADASEASPWFTQRSRAFVVDASVTYGYLGEDFAGALGGELGLSKAFGGIVGARVSLGGGAAVGGSTGFGVQEWAFAAALELRAHPGLTLGAGGLVHALSFNPNDPALVAERSTSVMPGGELHALLHLAGPFGPHCLVRGRFLGPERQVTSDGAPVLTVPAWSFGLAVGVRWAFGE